MFPPISSFNLDVLSFRSNVFCDDLQLKHHFWINHYRCIKKFFGPKWSLSNLIWFDQHLLN